MTTPELAIAKAALSASLFRADPASISRPAVEAFLQLLDSTLTQCSRPNVQNCRDYISSNIAHSTGRTTSLAKYLVALSKSQDDDSSHFRPSSKRRRLHILYIVNDVLHHIATKQGPRPDFIACWEAFLPAMFGSAASFGNCPKHFKKLGDLIDIWEERRYVPEKFITKLKGALADGGSSAETADSGSTPALKLAKEEPFVIPSFHGDATTAWYDLPAASWLPHLVPNSTKPMMPNLIRPIQLAAGPASKELIDAVKALLVDADRIFSKEKLALDDPHAEINELGERTFRDEITGDIISGETYYGWSRDFCKRMKERKNSRHQSRGRSYSRSMSRSRSRSRNNGFSRDRRRRSPSSSPSYKRRRISRSRSTRSRSYSRSRSRSRGPRGLGRRSRSPSHPPPQIPNGRKERDSFPHPHPSEQSFGLPIPPPPPGYQGPWPPPPPPLPPNLAGPPPGWLPDPSLAAQMMGSWNGTHAPPPPPPQQQPQYSSQDGNRDSYRGGHDGTYRGRGAGSHRGGGSYGRNA